MIDILQKMEEVYFNDIRGVLSKSNSQITSGKMMHSEAIVYKGQVFAFLSGKKKMVFKLDKDFSPIGIGKEVTVFNPFTKRAPLNGWFEVPYSEKELWKPLAEKALKLLIDK